MKNLDCGSFRAPPVARRPPFKVGGLCLAAGLGLMGACPMVTAQSAALSPPAQSVTASEWVRLREGLRRAKPMPIPENARKPGELKADVATPAGDLVRFDAKTRKMSVVLPGASGNQTPLNNRTQGFRAVIPTAINSATQVTDGKNRRPGIGLLATQANTTILPAIAATPPSPFYYPYYFPWNTQFRLMMRFPVPGFPDQYFFCSASSVSDFHLLSAAHCVYNHDPLEDGSGRGAGFAAEIWAWPAETDVVDPLDPNFWPDFPYGVAKMTVETTYTAWINSSDLDWDFSFIALDRRIGDHVGWPGTEWGAFTTALNFDGYPLQFPYVPSNNPYQYPGYDANNVIGYSCCRIALNAYTYGGHSGGGVWRFDGTNTYLEGVNSTSNRAGYAEATQFTAQTHTDLVNTIATDLANRPPADLAQLIEYVFNGSSKGLGSSLVAVGDTLELTLNAFNAGYTPAGDTTAAIYLTSGQFDVSTGIYIGSVDLGYLDTYSYTVQTQSISIPSFVPPGTYRVGWVLTGSNLQYGTDNNSALIAAHALQIVGISSVATNPTSVVGGSRAAGSVSLTGAAPTSGVHASLSSSSRVARVPAGVTIAAGTTSAPFRVTTLAVPAITTVTITAIAGGVAKTTTITVNPPSLSSLQVAPASLSGGGSAQGTVTLTGPAPSRGITVRLASSRSTATVPAAVVVPAGSSTVSFNIATAAVTARVVAQIKASLAGVHRTASLTIKP